MSYNTDFYGEVKTKEVVLAELREQGISKEEYVSKLRGAAEEIESLQFNYGMADATVEMAVINSLENIYNDFYQLADEYEKIEEEN